MACRDWQPVLETIAGDAPQRARFEKLVKDAGFAFDAEGVWRYLFRTREAAVSMGPDSRTINSKHQRCVR
jgi:hypothetical protein